MLRHVKFQSFGKVCGRRDGGLGAGGKLQLRLIADQSGGQEVGQAVIPQGGELTRGRVRGGKKKWGSRQETRQPQGEGEGEKNQVAKEWSCIHLKTHPF